MADGPDLSPRTITRWRAGQPIRIKGVTPTPFGPARARELLAGGCDLDRMTDGEQAYVLAAWDTMPGWSCLYDAVCRIRDGSI